jgi:uncharacterized membrane protein YgcG
MKARTGLLIAFITVILLLFINYAGYITIIAAQLKAITILVVVCLAIYAFMNYRKLIPGAKMQYNSESYADTLYSQVEILYSVNSPIKALRHIHKEIDFTDTWYGELCLSNGQMIYFLRYPVDDEHWGVMAIDQYRNKRTIKSDLDQSYSPALDGDMKLLKFLRASLDTNISPEMDTKIERSWTSSGGHGGGGGGGYNSGQGGDRRAIKPLSDELTSTKTDVN